MKKLLVVVIVLGIYQSRDGISNLVFGAPDYAAAGNEVVLYATAQCDHCERTRELFAEKNIPYVEYDIETSSRAHRDYRRLGGRGVPVVAVNGAVVHGYAPNQILSLLRR